MELTADGVVEIICPDLKPMLAFYMCLGFCVERQTAPFAMIAGFSIRLFLAEDRHAMAGKRWINIRLLVPNVDKVWVLVRTLGIPIAKGIADRLYGLRDFTIEDPSGLDIRFAQVL